MEDIAIYGNSNFTFKHFIENKLKENNLRRIDFKVYVGWNSDAYSQNLNDVSNLRLRNIRKISEFLSMEFDQLLEEVLKFEKYQIKK